MRTVETLLLVVLRGWLVFSECPNDCTCTRFWVSCFLGDLHEHLPSLPSTVERLELMHSNISTLSRESVGVQQSLKELYLEKTAVEDIRRGAFLDSRGLAKLTVKSGRLRVIHRGAFAGLDRLRVLDLSGNRLTRMVSGSLDGIASLSHLDLSSNILNSIPSDIFQYFSPLIDEDVLVFEVKLELSGNLLTKLVFYNYKTSATLTNFQLSVNKLSGIYRDMFVGLGDLQILNLKDNLIFTIQPGSFSTLYNLQILDITENKIQRIDQGTFKGLSQLRYLYLDENPLNSVEPKTFLNLSLLHTLSMKSTGIHLLEADTFKGLTSLQFLDLSWTNVSKIEPESFQNNHNLAILKLTRPSAMNYYSTVDKLHLETFVGLKSLRTLIFKTGLKELQPKVFIHLKDLTELDLSKLGDFDTAFIETVHAEAFAGLSLLRKLDLNGNNITHLHNGTFSPLKRLKYLDLSGNPLLEIETAAFQGLSHMRFIGLPLHGSKDLRRIFEDAEVIESLRLEDPDNTCFDLQYRATNFDKLNNITVFSLDITCYGIEVLKKNIFRAMKALNKLNLGWNGIRALHKDSLVDIPNLIELKLYKNSISSLEPGCFNGVPTLTLLDISSNNLTTLRGDEFSTTNCTVTCGLPSLKYLDLSYNKISDLDVKTFKAMKSLLTLDLSDNMLSCFQSNTFRHNTRLEILRLVNNELFHIDNRLVFPQSIQELDFYNCNITSVQRLNGLVNLRVLNLSFNSLDTLSYGILRSLAGLRQLELTENPLVCDCELQKTWNWIQSYEINSLYAIRCDGFEDWNWDDPLSQLKCETPVAERYVPKPRVNLLADIEFFKKYVEPVVLFLILLIGLIGNGLLLFIFVRHSELRSGPNLCILNMTLADVLSLIVNLPLSYAESQMTWALNVTACRVYRFLRDLTVGLTVFSVVALALQRQRVTSDSFKVHDDVPCLHIKPDFAYPLIAWIFSVSFSLSALMTATVQDDMCLYVSEENIGMDLWKIWLYHLMIFCVIPICVVGYAYIRTAWNLKDSVRHLPESAKYSAQACRRLAVARMSLALMTVFVVSYAPNFVLRILVAWSVMEPWSKLTVYTSFVSYCLFFVMSCFNPVALCIISTEYKKLFHSYLCRVMKMHKS